MEHGGDWSVRMTQAIGKRVAAIRESKRTPDGRKMTVQYVADECDKLGLPLGRVTITKLENGDRQAVTPAEVMLLAYVLGVPPIELLLPVGTEKEAEVLPGKVVPTTTAVQWVTGKTSLVETGDGLSPGRPAWNPRDLSNAELLVQHDAFCREFRDSIGRRAAGSDGVFGPAHVRMVESWLRAVRDEMRARSLVLPELDSDLAYIDAG